MKIAIDGTAGSGKGTLATKLSKHLNFPHLDTGKLYRKVAYRYMQTLGKLNIQDIIHKDVIIDIVNGNNFLNTKLSQIYTEKVGIIASKIAIIPELRNELNKFQISFANEMQKTHGGCILDGRDIGTIIIPNAEIKFFVVASPETRALRRLKEYKISLVNNKYNRDEFNKILKSIQERDENDMKREISPLKQATDAIKIDTTNLNTQEVLEIAMSYIKKIA